MKSDNLITHFMRKLIKVRNLTLLVNEVIVCRKACQYTLIELKKFKEKMSYIKVVNLQEGKIVKIFF